MNKNLHRIIFNKKRGQLMVVAETACAQGKDASGQTTGGNALHGAGGPIQCTVQALNFALAVAWGTALLVLPVANLAQAQVVADPTAPGGQRPTILGTANGLPQINIQTPSAAGVSRNTYSQFDIQANGAILNNSRTNVQTQLGGFVSANPWLATGAARVILNEVNSSSPSQIRGYVEVAGQRAEVIIANPAGININGGGFLNASGVTLTTGTPVISGGNLDAYRVQRGAITVSGAGLDTSTADYTNILARSFQANAGLWAKDLKVVTGANEVNAASLTSTPAVTPIAGTGPAPTFAVDVGLLGGMYAGKIFLVGTETGIGVSNVGYLGATAGSVVLQTGGWLTSSGVIQAAANAQINAASGITNSGTVYANGDTTLVSQGSISNTGTTAVIAAKGNTTLEANGVGSQISASTGSTIAAGMNANGSMTNSGLLTVKATDSANLNGQLIAGGDAAITGTQLNLAGSTLAAQNASLTASTGGINATGATLNATGTLGLSTATTLRTDGATVSANQLNTTARDLSNVGGQIIQSGTGDTTIALAGDLNNTSGRIASNSQNLTLQTSGSGGLTNTDGKIEHGGSGTLTINVANGSGLSGQRGQITSTGALALTAGAVNLDNATTSAQKLTLSAASLSNRSGQILQTGTDAGSITATGAIDNTAGRIVSNGNNTFTAQSLNNQGGVIQATGTSSLGMTTAAALDNSASGQIAAGGANTISAGTLNNNLGRITAGTSLSATSTGLLNNIQGLIAANGATTLSAASVDNTRGTIASVQNTVQVTSSGNTVNDSGRIEAAADVTLASTGLSNTKAAGQTSAGSITGRNLDIRTGGQALNNAFGTLSAAQGITLQTGALNNDAGLIQAAGTAQALSINTNGQTLTNTNAAGYASGAGGISAQGTLSLNTGALDNTAGFIGVKGALTATSGSVSNTGSGQIAGESSVSFISTAFNNTGGQVQALGDVSLNAGTGVLNNSTGLIRSAANTTLAAASIVNSNSLGTNQGIEGNNVTITANGVNAGIANDSGAIRANNNITLAGSGSLNNNAGLISAGSAATVQDTAATPAARTLAMSNTAGTLIAGQSAAITAASAAGNGRLLSQGALSMTLNTDFNNTGEFIANGDATITTTANINNSGKLKAGGTLALTAATIDNAAAGEISGTTTKLTATAANTLINRGLIDGVTTQIDTITLNNIGTGRIYGDTLSIAATTVNNTAETVGGVTKSGVIAARNRLDIGATTINNGQDALIFSAGSGVSALNIGGSLNASRQATGSASAVNNAGGTIESLGGLGISAATINNTNPQFAYNISYTGGSTSTREYVTGQGVYTNAQIAWVAAYSALTTSASGGLFYGCTYINNCAGLTGQGRIVLPSSPYANAVYQPYYGGAHAYVPATQGVDGDGGAITSPARFAYEPSSPVWQVFGVAQPTAAAPTDQRPVDDPFNGPPNPALLAAWDAAAAPWVTLQAKLDAFRASINGSAITFDSFRDYTQAIPNATITQSAPGKILSGGAMTLNASSALVNDQSQIIAGGALNVTGASVQNLARTTTVNTQRTGTAYVWTSHSGSCDFSGCGSYSDYTAAAYAQDVPTTLTLNVSRSQSLLSPASQGLASGTTLASAVPGATAATATAAGLASASARSAGIVQVTASAPATSGPFAGTTPVIRTSVPNLTVPANSLFSTLPGATARYLIETDSRFTNLRVWLSSDYITATLSLDPTVTQKRLGDGFYEQKLIQEQVAQLTGQRFLTGYTSDEVQYQALMDAGITFAQTYNLRPGIALSAAQAAQLTSDIVWLVEQTVTLPDGSTQKVLVPQLYARVKDGDLNGAGVLLAGNTVNLNLTGDLTNAGSIAGRTIVNLTAQNVQNLGGRITGNAVTAAATNDLNNIGGQIDAAASLNVSAGRDLNVTSTTSSASNQVGANSFSLTGLDRIAGLYVSNPGGTLVASAGRDLNLTAALINNSGGSTGVSGNTTLTAGNNINLATVNTASSSSVIFDSDNFFKDSQSKDTGSQISTKGNLTLTAGNDLNAKAANVQATGNLTATAGNNINITAGQQTNSTDFGMTTRQSDLFSSSSTRETRSSAQTTAAGSSFGGNNVTLTAGNDLNVKGSSVIADTNTTLSAGRKIAIEAATNTSSSTAFKEIKESGLLDSGGMGVSFGNRQQSTDNKTQSTTAAASTVGAIAGNVNITAGSEFKQVGSDVTAPGGNINITAKTVNITEARETSKTDTETKFSQSGITVAISNPMLSALQTADNMGQAIGNTSDARMQALGIAAAGLNAYNTYNSLLGKDGKIDPAKATDISINVSIGSSQSQSNTSSNSDTARGSSVSAGNNVSITATGAGADSNLTVQGSTVKAGNNTTLTADNQVNLLAAQNTSTQTSTNSSSSSSMGVSYSPTTNSVGFSASASQGKGSSNGQDLSFTNTSVNAGNAASIQSGGDTTLKGAVVTGKTVIADVGGSLNIQSLQDTGTYTGQQSSAGGSLSFGTNAAGTASLTGGGVSASQSKIDSSFASVGQQSGIKAGDGGFQVSVANNTDLKGGVIASTQAAVDQNRNSFTTGGTLSISDIQNSASYKGDAVGISVSAGKGLGPDGKTIYLPGGGVGIGSASGNAASVTTAGISGIAGNTAVRTADAETGLKPIFDAAKVQADINAQVAITAEFGKQASKAVGDYAQAQLVTATNLRAQASAKAQAGDTQGAATLDAQALAIEGNWGNTGTSRLFAHTLIGALTGGLDGALGAAVGTLTAPLVADALKNAGIDGPLASTLTALASTAAGALAGGNAGAAAGFNEVVNNFLLHNPANNRQSQLRGFAEQLARCKATAGCNVDGVYAYWSGVSASQQATAKNAVADWAVSGDAANLGAFLAGAAGALGANPTDFCTSGDTRCYQFIQSQNTQVFSVYRDATISMASMEYVNGMPRATGGTVPVIKAGFPETPPGYQTFEMPGLLPNTRGIVDTATGEIRVLTSAGQIADVPATPFPTWTTAADNSSIKIVWGKGIQAQGMPWEDYLAGQMPASSRLPTGFKTFDFYDQATRTATSAKTLDTMTTAKISDPVQVYSSIKGNIDDISNFSGAQLGDVNLRPSDIAARQLQIAVPATTTSAQWQQINSAVLYGEANGVKVVVTTAK